MTGLEHTRESIKKHLAAKPKLRGQGKIDLQSKEGIALLSIITAISALKFHRESGGECTTSQLAEDAVHVVRCCETAEYDVLHEEWERIKSYLHREQQEELDLLKAKRKEFQEETG